MRGPAASDAVLLLHSQERGQALVEELGRAAQLGEAQGVPANVIPVALWHTASIGIDLWLSAIAFGASQVCVLVTGEEAPQYLAALQGTDGRGAGLLNGLGYTGTHFSSSRPATIADARPGAGSIARHAPAACPPQAARFAVGAGKAQHAGTGAGPSGGACAGAKTARGRSACPAAGSPFGAIEVNKDKCTLCLSCVGACPASALQDNPNVPQLRFIEKNCVQCGLCATTCPEDAITLQPRLLLTPERKEAGGAQRGQPYACIRCGKPFGTLKAIEAMLGKLAGHAMFQGAALERLKMCGDCRVIDIYSAPGRSEDHRRYERTRFPVSSALDEETARAEVYGLLARLCTPRADARTAGVAARRADRGARRGRLPRGAVARTGRRGARP